ncbi:MAG: flagellar FlbD family protein [Marmoricola sp.]
MITLTRLSGSVFVLNSDLIERIDATPDSVVTLVDGKKYVVAESLEEIVDAVRTYRGQVVAVSAHLADQPVTDAPPPGEQHRDHRDRPLATVATLPTPGPVADPAAAPSLGHGEA